MSHLGKHLRSRKAARIADSRGLKPRDAVLVVDDGDHYGSGIARALLQIPREGRCVVTLYCYCDAHEPDHCALGRDLGPRRPALKPPRPHAQDN